MCAEISPDGRDRAGQNGASGDARGAASGLTSELGGDAGEATGAGSFAVSGADSGAKSGAKSGGQDRLSFLDRLFGRGADGPAPETGVRAVTGPVAVEREMLINIRRLRSLKVIDVMVPRGDIVCLPVDAPLEDVVAAFRETGHTRLPVYRETLDDPLGFAHLKDIALKFGFGGDAGTFDLQANLRPVLYAPPSMPISALLQKMQGGRVHMALVIDEYGGVDGLVTIEDLLEQIVGEIEDEHDVEEEAELIKEGAGSFIASARVKLPEFEAEANVDLLPDDVDEEVDTLGGLLFVLADRVPERGEVIRHPDGHEFEVLDGDARRVKRVRVRLAGAPASRAAE